jgi:hypothetical protein
MTSPSSDQHSPVLSHQSEDYAIHAEAAPKDDRTVPERLDGGTLWRLRAMPTCTREQADASGVLPRVGGSRVLVSFKQLGDLAEASVSEVGRQTWRWSSRPTRCTIQQIPVEPCASFHSCPALPQQRKGRPRSRSSRCCISSSSDISSCCQYPPEAGCHPAAPRRHAPLAYCAVEVGHLDGKLELNVADVRRFLGSDPAAVGEIFGTSERRFKVPSVREC